MFNEYPYTDYHELNTDWIIGKIKNVETAEANTKQYAEDADAAKVAAEDARDIAVQAKDDAVEAKDDAVEAKDDAISFLTDTKDQLDLLQARVDNIIPDGTQTAGNLELLDIRVGYNGTTYASAGDAVRDQIGDIEEDLGFIIDTDKYGKNIFNEKANDAFTYGQALDANGDPSITDPNFKISDYIPISSVYGNKITVSWSTTTLINVVRICGYAPDKSFVGNLAALQAKDGPVTFNISSSYAYIRISIRKELDHIQVEYGNTATTFVAGFTANDDNARHDLNSLKSLVNITAYTLTESDWEQGSLDASGAEVNAGVDYPLRIRTGFLSVGTGSIIKYTPASSDNYMAICYYDANNNFISRTGWTNTSDEITSIAPVVRFVVRNSTNSAINVDASVMYNFELAFNRFVATSNWVGKKWVSYGDSITQAGLWQPYVISRFGLSHTNMGIGGTRVSERNTASSSVNANWFGDDTRISNIPLDTELITIMGGTNDFGTPPSELVTPTWDSVNQRFGAYGFQNGLCETVRKIYARIPTVQIVLMSLTGGQYTDNTYDMPQRKNSLGYTGEDYAKATEEVANLLNLPYIPIWNDGINVFNRTLYIADTVHPNSDGAKLIARMVNGWLLTNEPV